MSELLDVVTHTLDTKLAKDIKVIDMRNVSGLFDYFVVCTASSLRQANALADYVEDAAYEAGYKVRKKEGTAESSWVLIDLHDVIVHIYTEEARKTYRLETLWGDQPQFEI